MKVAGAPGSLAERYGIEPEFVDARGVVQQTSPQAKRLLLAALRARAETDAAAAAILDECEAADWMIGLPPVLVAEREHIRVPIVAPHGSGEIAWRLALEGGGELAAAAAFAGLALLGSVVHHGEALERRELVLPPAIAYGYHELSVASCDRAMSLIVTPGRCWLPPAIEAGARLSGSAVQLYLLRSNDDWGIGDFTDLRAFVELVAERGGDIVGLNPLHQMFFDDPEHASPYSPASRLLINAADVLPRGHALDRETLFTAAHAFLGATQAALAVGQIDDVTDEIDPVNVPATSDQYPNRRRRLARTIEELPTEHRIAALFWSIPRSGATAHVMYAKPGYRRGER